MANGTIYYMANCVTRVMRAPCSIQNMRQRDEDVTQASVIASSQGLDAAHQYLIQLCNEAEAGKYAAQQSVHPTPPSALPIVRVSKSGKVSIKWSKANTAGG